MPFVTTLTLTSGDRHRLDNVVADIKARAERKGVELKGPHPKPPEELRVPQSKTLGPDGDRFDPWNYTVYTRTIEIVGYETFAREVTAEAFPAGVHVEAGVEQRTQFGSGS
ncbi:uS10/mL48 family ribosomal protein [Haloarcula sp. S1CR25-12]|uniref:Small ribosomal subunit protein uS10 n=1 Tax=Haloarcula saliterrae TaxID=2950534 RepID=A0ABU2F727_9EURY|nr:uS10/mL48 family ribosomal protein [Haloarcula sp. S1CR25-12]MDS0258075.1 uS10/mL48 family ribosomal protein [Haloarcula sp. S1CR25-12]